jgi:uncharacterized delta-60 repeat protein
MKHLLTLAWCTLTLATAQAQPGSIDLSFDPGASVQNPSAVEAIAIQTDGKIIAVGGFLTYDGQPSKNIVRINPDGTRDQTFDVGSGFTAIGQDPSGSSGRCQAVAIQSDGKILVGGFFTSYNGTSINRIARLNADGSIDQDFAVGIGSNNAVQDIAVQADGSIVCGGQFTSYNSINRSKVARLLPNGTLDIDFVPPAIDGNVFNVVPQADGKVLLGGTITSVGGTTVGRLVRLNSDGSLEAGFPQGTGFNSLVLAIHLMDDGRMMVGGGFTEYDGSPRARIVRLMPDGSIDATFQAFIGSGSDQVRAIVEQDDGKYVVLGGFSTANSMPAGRVVRLMPDGMTDPSFDPGLGFANVVQDALLQPDGKLVAGGFFTAYDNVPRVGVVRVNTAGTSAIAEETGLEFELFPNPTNGLVTLRGDLQGKVEVRVLDAAGRLMYESRVQGNGAEPVLMDLSALDTGVYVVQLRAKDQVATRTVVRE